jgi:AcrR family transcriptional regulator
MKDSIEKELAPTSTRILVAAIESITQVGLYRTSSNEVARRAGVTWGSIAHHFGSRMELMVAATERLGFEYCERLEAAQFTGATVGERLAEFAELVASIVHGDGYRAYMSLMVDLEHDESLDAGARERIRALVERAGAAWSAALRFVDPVIAEDPGMYWLFFCVVRGVELSELLLRAWPPRQLPWSDEDVARARKILVSALAGIVSETGAPMPPPGSAARSAAEGVGWPAGSDTGHSDS